MQPAAAAQLLGQVRDHEEGLGAERQRDLSGAQAARAVDVEGVHVRQQRAQLRRRQRHRHAQQRRAVQRHEAARLARVVLLAQQLDAAGRDDDDLLAVEQQALERRLARRRGQRLLDAGALGDAVQQLLAADGGRVLRVEHGLRAGGRAGMVVGGWRGGTRQ
jgi:hypothetical protein